MTISGYLRHRAQLLALATLLALPVISLADSQWLLACSNRTKVDYWAVDENTKRAALVASWTAPKNGEIIALHQSNFSGPRLLVSYLIRADHAPQQHAVVLWYRGPAEFQSIKLGRIGPGFASLSPFGDRIAVVGEDGKPRYREINTASGDYSEDGTEVSENSDFESTDSGSFPKDGVFSVRSRYRTDGDTVPDSIALYVWEHDKVQKQSQFKFVLPNHSATVSKNGDVYVMTPESLQLRSGGNQVSFEVKQFRARSTTKSSAPGIFLLKNNKNFDVIVNHRGEQLLTSRSDHIFPSIAKAVNAAINLDKIGQVAIATDREVQIGEWGADRFSPMGTLPGAYLRLAYLGSTHIEPGDGSPMGRPTPYVPPAEKPELEKLSTSVNRAGGTQTPVRVNQQVIERHYTHVVEDSRSRQFWVWFDMVRNNTIKAFWATSLLGVLGYGIYRMQKRSNALGDQK